MRKRGPIVIIDDDADDREMLFEILKSLKFPNEIVSLKDGSTALEYLQQENVNPFMIISDINMPVMNGYQLRQRILEDSNLRRKCVPFIFFTTASSDETVAKAYDCSAQGFFYKFTDYIKFYETMENIVHYWLNAETPVFPDPLVH